MILQGTQIQISGNKIEEVFELLWNQFSNLYPTMSFPRELIEMVY